ncbi:MAG TPA: hypothetical protein VF341_03560, partial [Anaeromyxobacteraceae bacterium]
MNPKLAAALALTALALPAVAQSGAARPPYQLAPRQRRDALRGRIAIGRAEAVHRDPVRSAVRGLQGADRGADQDAGAGPDHDVAPPGVVVEDERHADAHQGTGRRPVERVDRDDGDQGPAIGVGVEGRGRRLALGQRQRLVPQQQGPPGWRFRGAALGDGGQREGGERQRGSELQVHE